MNGLCICAFFFFFDMNRQTRPYSLGFIKVEERGVCITGIGIVAFLGGLTQAPISASPRPRVPGSTEFSSR